MNNYDETLVEIFETAAGKAFTSLINAHGEEHFYYFALLIDECLRPYVSAWSYEALEKFYKENEVDDEEKDWYKWSGVESPYEAYGWDEYFAGYTHLLYEREQAADDEDTFCRECELRMDAAEEAMRRLDAKGIFGTGGAREGVVITVECVPPERPNYDRVARLNKTGLIEEFLEENTDLLEEDE
mgnify:FL=1